MLLRYRLRLVALVESYILVLQVSSFLILILEMQHVYI
jgi:hypothetical protein